MERPESVVTPSRKRKRVGCCTIPILTLADRLILVDQANGADETHVPKPTKSRTRGQRTPGQSKDDGDEDEESEMSPEEKQNEIIRNLKVASRRVNVITDHSNEVHERENPHGRQAYAKIAGREWTFYVNELEINIGRHPDDKAKNEEPAPAQGGTGANAAGIKTGAESAGWMIHIDLGPHKLISRLHATIRFDHYWSQWFIQVNGRNGVLLDDVMLPRGQSSALSSGVVIEIGGTQMMFLLPNEPARFHPRILRQAQVKVEDESEEDETFQRVAQPVNPPPSHVGGYDPFQQRNQAYGNAAQQANTPALPYSIPATPGRLQAIQQGKITSPAYSRGLMLESTEEIDYSQDSAKDLKPPHSYAQLIGMAILASPEEKLTLANIYSWIKERYAFYRFSGSGWQNSIRHNLSLNKCFEKIARRTDEPGKGMKWQIVPEHRDEFLKKGLTGTRKNAGRSSSAPNSPGNGNLYQPAQPGMPLLLENGIKNDPHSVTPPSMSAYPVAPKEAFTPDRGSRPHTSQVNGSHSTINGLPSSAYHRTPPQFATSGTPGRLSDFPQHLTQDLQNLAGSPIQERNPAAFSQNIFLGPSSPGHSLTTPMVTRKDVRLAPPSTVRMPSQFMPMSSPAPFWKFADWVNGTPATAKKRTVAEEASPVKRSNTGGGVDVEVPVESSSPPPANLASPTRSQGPSSRRDLSNEEGPTSDDRDKEGGDGGAVDGYDNVDQHAGEATYAEGDVKGGAAAAGAAAGAGVGAGTDQGQHEKEVEINEDKEDEDEGFDLTK